MSTTTTVTLRICLDDTAAPATSYNTRSTGKCEVYVSGWDSLGKQPTWIASHESAHTDMTITSYYGGDFPQQTWSWQYGISCNERLITPGHAVLLAKRLTTLDRKYTKLCAKMGQPQTFGQYVVYLAQCMGIAHFCWSQIGTYGASQWRETTMPEEARFHIDRHIAMWHEAHPLPEKDVA